MLFHIRCVYREEDGHLQFKEDNIEANHEDGAIYKFKVKYLSPKNEIIVIGAEYKA